MYTISTTTTGIMITSSGWRCPFALYGRPVTYVELIVVKVGNEYCF